VQRESVLVPLPEAVYREARLLSCEALANQLYGAGLLRLHQLLVQAGEGMQGVMKKIPTAEREPLRLSDPGVPDWISHVAECAVCGL
jgi:hypothetical protein